MGKASSEHILTEREQEVLRLLATKGSGNKEIAIALGIEEATVKVHIKAIIRMMGVKNRTQAALRAQEFVAVGEQGTFDVRRVRVPCDGDVDILTALNDACSKLPACSLLAVVGGAIQEITALRAAVAETQDAA